MKVLLVILLIGVSFVSFGQLPNIEQYLDDPHEVQICKIKLNKDGIYVFEWKAPEELVNKDGVLRGMRYAVRKEFVSGCDSCVKRIVKRPCMEVWRNSTGYRYRIKYSCFQTMSLRDILDVITSKINPEIRV